jgi:hypothetical protein
LIAQTYIIVPIKKWCSIKDDNRTLFGLGDVDLIDKYTAIKEEEDDE